MVCSGLLRRVALVRTDVSEEPGASFIRVTKNSHRRENLKSYKYFLIRRPIDHTSHSRVGEVAAPARRYDSYGFF
jgi:hypothetical protein